MELRVCQRFLRHAFVNPRRFVRHIHGVPTGLDFEALLALRGRIAGWLEGEALQGAIWRAGLPKTVAA